MAISLRVLSGARVGHVESFDRPLISIGRNPTSDLRFDPEQDRDVSKDHGQIWLVDGRWMLRDIKSTNGTWVNGRRIEGDYELQQGDVVAFGRRGPQVAVDFDRTGSMAAPKNGHTTPRGHEPPLASTFPPRVSPPAQPPSPAGGVTAPSSRAAAAAPAAPAAPLFTPATPPPPAGVRRPTDVRIQEAVTKHTRGIKLFAGAVLGIIIVVAGGAWWMEHRQVSAAQAQANQLVADLQQLQQSLSAQANQSSGRIAALDSAYASSQRTIVELSERVRDRPTTESVQLLSSQLAEAKRQQQSLASATPEAFEAINTIDGPAVAMLYVQMPDSKLWSGTAFVLTSNGIMATNRHLVRDEAGRAPERLAVKFNGDDEVRRAHVLSVSDVADLAFIQLDDPGPYKTVKGVKPSATSLKVGAPVATIGFPHGPALAMEARKATATFDVGTVSKMLPDRLQLTTYAAEGASGSPIFDKDGYVVGVIYGGPTDARGRIVYAVPSEHLAISMPPEARRSLK